MGREARVRADGARRHPALRLNEVEPASSNPQEAAPLRYWWHPERYAVVQLPPDAPLPSWAAGAFVSATRTADAFSLVADAEVVPAGLTQEGPFALLELEGPLPFTLTGVLARVSAALAAAQIPILPIGTYRTDFVLVPLRARKKAAAALSAAGLYERPRPESFRYGLFPTPFGHLLLAGSARGVAWAALGDDADTLIAPFLDAHPEAQHDDDALAPVRRALLASLSGAPFTHALDLRGTPFQRRIWEVLRTVAPGETVTYADVAARAGLPLSAARVVAQAVAANPIALAVPCHRVVRGDERPTPFRWGAARKVALLLFERQGQLSLFEPALT